MNYSHFMIAVDFPSIWIMLALATLGGMMKPSAPRRRLPLRDLEN